MNFNRLLTSVCGSPFWNSSTIYSENPDFTFCFQYTVLLWMPCAVLWMISPLWIYMLTRQPKGKIRISWILISKSICTLFLIAIEVFNLIRAFSTQQQSVVYFLTPYILIVTELLALFLMHLERLRNLRSSTLMFTFFSLLTLDSVITFRSKLINQDNMDIISVYIFFAFFTLVLGNTILSVFSEKSREEPEPEETIDNSGEKKLKKMPEERVNLLSKLWFWWMNDLIKTGFKRDLVRDDLWEIEDTESSALITKRLEDSWNKKANEYILKVRQHPELEKPAKAAKPKSKTKKDKKTHLQNKWNQQRRRNQAKPNGRSIG